MGAGYSVNLLRKTRRVSYAGDISGYSYASLSLEGATRVLPGVPARLRGSRVGAYIIASLLCRVVPRVPKTAFCFIQSATTGFTPTSFRVENRVSLKEAFEGLEPDEGKVSRPVLRGPGTRNGGLATRLAYKVGAGR